MPVDTTVLRGAVRSGFLAKSVAGAVDVVLTPQEAIARAIQFTGAITANINVVLPLGAESSQGEYLFKNSTSGSFTLTVKGSIGSGVAITAAKKVIMMWTGADFEAWTAEL